MYSNVRGIKGKKASLTETVHEFNHHIFLITETQLRSNNGVSIEGYTFYSKCRTSANGGGVGILIRNDIKMNVTPHVSDRETELMWISLRRKNLPPLIIGTYYGKQENKTTKAEIEREMMLLNEEIAEMKADGEILLAMDGNAKIGILGEPISRNGSLLLRVVEDNDLTIMNKSVKCKGKVTRENTKNAEEKSAIDYIITSKSIEEWIENMVIDEEGTAKIRGKTESDHNTIIIDLKVSDIDKTFRVKRTMREEPASTCRKMGGILRRA